MYLSRFFYFTALKLRYLIPIECLNYPPFTYFTEAVAQRCSVKKVFLKISQNSQENTCARVCFLTKLQAWGLHLYCAQTCNFINKYTLAQVFSCEFCEIFKSTFFLWNTSCGCFWFHCSGTIFQLCPSLSLHVKYLR